jgi:hypothetical protein
MTSTTTIALPLVSLGITKEPLERNSSYLRTPPPAAAAVAQVGTPAVPTESTWLAVPIPNRATVAEPEAYRMSPAVVTVFFGIAVPAKS